VIKDGASCRVTCSDCVNAGAISLCIFHGIIGRENQHTRLSFKANGLIRDAVAVGID
jgi:hypothetical protein